MVVVLVGWIRKCKLCIDYDDDSDIDLQREQKLLCAWSGSLLRNENVPLEETEGKEKSCFCFHFVPWW